MPCSSTYRFVSYPPLPAQQAFANFAISKSSMRNSCLKVCKDVKNGSKKVHSNYFIVLYCNFDVEWTFCVCTEKYSYSRSVSPSIVLWVRAFLRDRPQTVCVNSVKSNELILNTGAPQGCVLSPILFPIYTNKIMSNTTTLTLIKFADNMALVARLKDQQSLSSYFIFIGHLISWFDESYLKLNVQKTKELFIE